MPLRWPGIKYLFVKTKFKSAINMKFFIDTANLAQIKEAADFGILDGVTTNPSLMAKEGIKGQEAILQHYKDISCSCRWPGKCGSALYGL